MPLDPYAKRLLGMLSTAAMPEASRLTPEEMRQDFARLLGMVGARNVGIGEVQHRDMPGAGGPLALRIYTPIEPEGETLPGLIYFHGGGGVLGSLDTHESLCRMLSNESGCRVAAVGYRVAPEHKFPAAVEDSYAATKWVAEHADELGIDRNRIAVGGDSAGGGLAAVVCQFAKRDAGPRLALQVLFYPAMDMSTETESRRAFADGYLLTRATLDWTLDHYCPTGLDRADPRLSPLRASDFSGLPPAHIHTAEFDPLRDEGKAYADRLEQAGVKATYTCHPGMIHHFCCMAGAIPYSRVAIRAAGAAIKEALARCTV